MQIRMETRQNRQVSKPATIQHRSFCLFATSEDAILCRFLGDDQVQIALADELMEERLFVVKDVSGLRRCVHSMSIATRPSNGGVPIAAADSRLTTSKNSFHCTPPRPPSKSPLPSHRHRTVAETDRRGVAPIARPMATATYAAEASVKSLNDRVPSPT